MRKKTLFWAAMLPALLGAAGMVMFYFVNNQQTYADEVISKASQSFESDLKKFIVNSEFSKNKLKTNTRDTEILNLNTDSLNAYAAQLVQSDSDLKGIILFSDQLNYVFFRDNTSWVTTFSKNNTDSLIDWQRLNDKLEVVSEWTDTYNFFMDKVNSHALHLALKEENQVIWKAAKSQVPDKRDLLFNIFRLDTKDKSPVVAAFMYKVSELENRFSTVLQFSRPLVTIITTENQTVTPIKTTDTAMIAVYGILSAEVKKLIANWGSNGGNKARVYSFEKLDQVFWTRIDTIAQQNGLKGFAITVAESDIFKTASRVDRILMYISLFLMLLSTLFYVVYRIKPKSMKTEKKLVPLSDDELKILISKGETEYVEFKSSLRWDYREEKVNKVLEDVILKSIAAFANAKGGTLFIGVNDALEVIGLEPDFNSLKKKDADYFELHLRKLINNQYGIRFSNTYLFMQFAVLKGKTVCVVQIAPSHYPLYLTTKNKQGQQIEKFYVRSGNASQEINLLNEINEYIAQRFKKN
ncbi:MAG: ATP-binding protein [Bacteroidales bacterium]|nr:ATP-binding protein [Bacteroidales bacterium]